MIFFFFWPNFEKIVEIDVTLMVLIEISLIFIFILSHSHALQIDPNNMYSQTFAASNRDVMNSGIKIIVNVSGIDPSKASKIRGFVNLWWGLCEARYLIQNQGFDWISTENVELEVFESTKSNLMILNWDPDGIKLRSSQYRKILFANFFCNMAPPS